MPGFFIKKVSVRGNNLKPAEVEFNAGPNVITGASDSGKTYIFEVLNYTLGSSAEPKEIDESNGYTDFFLEIVSFEDKTVYTLHRKLGADLVSVKKCAFKDFYNSAEEAKRYKTKGTIDENNLTSFLLAFSGLEGKVLLKNKSLNKKQKLSYKGDVLKFSFVSEQKIIKIESPFYYSDQYTLRTLNQSLLKIFLTGVDVSKLDEKEDKREKETRIGGKLEFIDGQLVKYVNDKDALQNELGQAVEDNTLAVTLDSLKRELEDTVGSAQEFINKKAQLIEEGENLKRSSDYTDELISRFSILRKQYESDQKRLEFVIEGEAMLSQLENSVCPVCASTLDQNHLDHLHEDDKFKEAAMEELKRTLVKLNDLSDALEPLTRRNKSFGKLIKANSDELQNIEHKLKGVLLPRIEGLRSDIKDYLFLENKVSKIKFIDDEITNLSNEKERLNRILSEKTEEESYSLIKNTVLNEYAKYIEKRLKAWSYEHDVTVVFDPEHDTFDIVISGKRRRSFGKGKRAISYSACLLGLLDYCKKENKPFTNLIVLDSPLTTYEEKKRQKTTEQLSSSIKNSFFKDIAEEKDWCQIIIFDNKEPEGDARDKVNLIIFTGDEETGRAGFFPVTQA